MVNDEKKSPSSANYRTPELIRLNEYPEHLHEPAMELLESFNKFSRILSQEMSWTRDQRESHAFPQVIASLLMTLDRGAAVEAARKFLESYSEEEKNPGGIL
jgi:hypothetical protein